ncbi:MAG: hypothetical protein K9L28_07725 [Synergistales bacterium]|nr:hypothetical protein [Synergistales bacterium]
MDAQPISQQPIFYLFIAATILIALGYSWGRRRSKGIYLDAFNALVDTLQPRDQNFTTIGGLSGYHANLIPKRNQPIRRVDATITLLARQSVLYYPVSRLTRKWDRLFLTLLFAKEAQGQIAEGHLIEKQYEDFKAPKVTNIDRLNRQELEWEGRTFTLYYETGAVRDALLRLKQKLRSPGELRHVALVPEQEQAHIFLVPKKGETARLFPAIYQWLAELLESKASRTRSG